MIPPRGALGAYHGQNLHPGRRFSFKISTLSPADNFFFHFATPYRGNRCCGRTADHNGASVVQCILRLHNAYGTQSATTSEVGTMARQSASVDIQCILRLTPAGPSPQNFGRPSRDPSFGSPSLPTGGLPKPMVTGRLQELVLGYRRLVTPIPSPISVSLAPPRISNSFPPRVLGVVCVFSDKPLGIEIPRDRPVSHASPGIFLITDGTSAKDLGRNQKTR